MKDLKEATWDTLDIMFLENTSKDTSFTLGEIKTKTKQLLCQSLPSSGSMTKLPRWLTWAFGKYKCTIFAPRWTRSTSSPTAKISRSERGLPTEMARFVRVSPFVAPSPPSWIANTILLPCTHGCCHSTLTPVHVFGILSINLSGIVIW